MKMERDCDPVSVMGRPRSLAVVVALACSSALSAAAAEEAAPTAPPTLIPVIPGGWTADAAAGRAATTSFDVAAKRHAVRAASAAVDQATIGYFPRLSGLARYQASPIYPRRPIRRSSW